MVSTLAAFLAAFACSQHVEPPTWRDASVAGTDSGPFLVAFRHWISLGNVAVQGAATELAVNNEWISERAQCPPPIDLKTICASLRWKAIWNHFCVRVFSAIQFRERHFWYTPLPLDVLAS